MTAVILTSALLAMVFPAFFIIKHRELPESISALVYSLDRGWQWLWGVWLFVTGLMACIAMIDKLPDNFKFAGFLTLVCIGFTASMPIIMKKHEKAHTILGVSAGVLSQLSVMLINYWWLILWVVLLVLHRCINGKMVFLAESICAITVYMALI